MTSRLAALLSLLAVAILAAGCAAGGGASTPASGTPASLEPGASPAQSFEVVGPVTTPEQAWAAVVAAEPRFADVQPLDPDLIGQSAWYEVQPASGVGAYIVTITIGWGDCQAGCIDEHTWQYAVGPDGTVTLQSESGDSVPPDAFPDGSTSDAS